MFTSRWNPCISHFKADAQAFISSYFARDDSSVMLVAGAGFDPRSKVVASALSNTAKNTQCVLVKEKRPSPDGTQVSQAEENGAMLASCMKNVQLIDVDIFGEDGAVIGGRNTINSLDLLLFDDIQDVIIDLSALSIGTSFPIVRYFVERCHDGKAPHNVHVIVTHDPDLDSDIRAVSSDEAGYIHGFKGELTLEASSAKAKMWLPQLAIGRNQALERLHQFLAPEDTCPIVPFPSADPRAADGLFWEYRNEIESAWSVSTRNIVYASEDDPVDLYRTILRLDDLRQPIFKAYGGSHVILSPLGSKLMALGALMAALERDLPVAYVEAVNYQLGPSARRSEVENPAMYHVWLEGRAYPSARPELRTLRGR